MTTTNPTTAEFLADKEPCPDVRDFILQFETMAQVWESCERPDLMFWLLRRSIPLTQGQAVRLAIAFAETVLEHIPEGEDRPHKAIEAARNWLKEPTEENRIAAGDAADAAYAAANAAANAAGSAADAAYASSAAHDTADAARAATTTSYAAADAARSAYAAAYAAHAAGDTAAGAFSSANAAYVEAQRKQCEIIREVIQNPFQ